MDIENVDVLKEETLSSIVYMDLIYWSFRSSSRRVCGCAIVILASCEDNFIRIHENLVQYPSDNISNVTTELDRIPFNTGFTKAKLIYIIIKPCQFSSKKESSHKVILSICTYIKL